MKNLIIIALFVAFGACSSPTSTPASGVTLGIIINQLSDRVNQMIQQAQNAGLILEVNAGGQIVAVLDQAKQVYENELAVTENALDNTQKKVVSDIT